MLAGQACEQNSSTQHVHRTRTDRSFTSAKCADVRSLPEVSDFGSVSCASAEQLTVLGSSGHSIGSICHAAVSDLLTVDRQSSPVDYQ